MIDDNDGRKVFQLEPKDFSSGINFHGHPIPGPCSQKAANLSKHEKELDAKKKERIGGGYS